MSNDPDTSRQAPARSGDGVLARSDVQARLPAQDLERARRFYAEKLGLHPVEKRPGGLRYRSDSTLFALFASATPTDLAEASPNARPGDHAAGENSLAHALVQASVHNSFTQAGGY